MSDVTSEIESIGRRTVLIHCPTEQSRDEAFKNSIRDPEFLDQLYSYLINQTPIQNIIGDGQDWIDATLKRWFKDCDPIFDVLDEQYQRVDDVVSIDKNTVYDTVLHALQEDGVLIPKNLQTQITATLKTMRIHLNNNRHHAQYLHIKPKLDESSAVQTTLL